MKTCIKIINLTDFSHPAHFVPLLNRWEHLLSGSKFEFIVNVNNTKFLTPKIVKHENRGGYPMAMRWPTVHERFLFLLHKNREYIASGNIFLTQYSIRKITITNKYSSFTCKILNNNVKIKFWLQYRSPFSSADVFNFLFRDWFAQSHKWKLDGLRVWCVNATHSPKFCESEHYQIEKRGVRCDEIKGERRLRREQRPKERGKDERPPPFYVPTSLKSYSILTNLCVKVIWKLDASYIIQIYLQSVYLE